MRRADPRAEYTATAKFFHWAVLALVAAQFAIAWTMPDVKKGTAPVGLIAWHLSVGTTILAFAVARLGWRSTHPAPRPPSDLSPVLAIISRATHAGLYLLLLVLPVMGWMNASARGWPVRLVGLIPLPRLVAPGSVIGRAMGDVHATTAIIFLLLIALHVTGALYHMLILRDRTIQRML